MTDKPKKVLIKVYLDSDIVQYFKQFDDWEQRINDVLRKAAGLGK